MSTGPVEQAYTTPDGCRLRTVRWEVPRPRGRVQVVHGLSEHIGRYRHLAEALNRAGYSVWGHDHRAHGKSEGVRGVVGPFARLVEDLGRIRSCADELAPGPGTPFLVAHSLGGLVAIRALQESSAPDGGAPWAAAVISAPWLATARIPLPHRILLPLVRRVAYDLPIPRPIRGDRLTRDEDEAAGYERDPLVVRALSVSFFDQVVEEQRQALASGLPAGLPTLVIVPGADELADPNVTMDWAADAGAHVESWRIPDTLHEPFNEVNRNNTFERLVDWLDSRSDGSL
ncbi:MAG: lysophospholipase [Gemmatimonadales bacterium]|jgi:alpha-beta hydrolase superfamily lysophospholipase|nr:MAG: lysophospholipase [Gemmatimonadales bacterium]